LAKFLCLKGLFLLESLGAVDAVEERPCDLRVDPVVEDGVHHFVQGVEAGLVGVEPVDVDLASFHASVLVVEVAVSGITQRRGLALLSVDFEMDAGAEGHCYMLFGLCSSCQISFYRGGAEGARAWPRMNAGGADQA
jgi:hypothetical protein